MRSHSFQENWGMADIVDFHLKELFALFFVQQESNTCTNSKKPTPYGEVNGIHAQLKADNLKCQRV